MIASLIAEIRENVQRYVTNAATLRSLLYHMGDETFLTCSDWDWRWSDPVCLATVLRKRFDDQRWRCRVPAQLAENIDAFYALLADQPPSMEEWAYQWSGEANTFYVFVIKQLDKLCYDVTQRASNLIASLRGA